MNWIPIDECPEEWKDGRPVLAGFQTSLEFTWHQAWFFRGDWRDGYGTSFQVVPTHIMLIEPPESLD